MSTIGWVDLEDILNLFKHNNELEWLKIKDINKLLLYQENVKQKITRLSEYNNLLLFLLIREKNKNKHSWINKCNSI
jgi:hypothetical protein